MHSTPVCALMACVMVTNIRSVCGVITSRDDEPRYSKPYSKGVFMHCNEQRENATVTLFRMSSSPVCLWLHEDEIHRHLDLKEE